MMMMMMVMQNENKENHKLLSHNLSHFYGQKSILCHCIMEGDTYLDALFMSLETVPQDCRRDFELVNIEVDIQCRVRSESTFTVPHVKSIPSLSSPPFPIPFCLFSHSDQRVGSCQHIFNCRTQKFGKHIP